MYFDTHAHYDSGAFNADWKELLASMPQKGVELIVNPGCDLESSRTAVALAEEFPHVYAAVGVHPSDCGEWGEGTLLELRQLASRPKVRAIGEIGLDYYWKDNPPRALQQNVFHRPTGAGTVPPPARYRPRPGGPPGLPLHRAGASPGHRGVPLLFRQPGGCQGAGQAWVDALLYGSHHLQERPKGPGGHRLAPYGPDHDRD